MPTAMSFEEAFNKSKMKIDIESAKIYRPWAKDMELMSRYYMVSP